MKKLVLLITVLALSLALVACGAPAPAPVASAPAAPASASEAPAAESEELVYTLDYDTIAAWVDGGFIGVDATNSPVVMAVDVSGDNAIIIFGDNSDMTAVSFVGTITYDEDLATITDEVNQTALTFGVTQISDDTIELDMGDVGTATIVGSTQEEVLAAIKAAIDNYTHVG